MPITVNNTLLLTSGDFDVSASNTRSTVMAHGPITTETVAQPLMQGLV